MDLEERVHKIRRRREEVHISLRDMAKHLGLTAAEVSSMELGYVELPEDIKNKMIKYIDSKKIEA